MLDQPVIGVDGNERLAYSFMVSSSKVAGEVAETLDVLMIEECDIVGERAYEGETMVLQVRTTPTQEDDEFQWFMGDKLLSQQTEPMLTLTGIPYAMNGVSFSCRVTRRGEKGALQELVTTKITVHPRMPTVLTSQPPQAVRPGSALRMTANDTNIYDEGYQWYFNGDPLDGETAPTLLVEKVDEDTAGCYCFQVQRAGKAFSCDITVALR